MSIIETSLRATDIIIGVDTHKSIHVAVAINEQGTRLAAISVPTNSKGYMELDNWSRSLGSVQAFGIEGTGPYGAGLSRYLMSLGLNIVAVTRPNYYPTVVCPCKS
ncbi:IS110 family transposase [Parasedimentitalea psychrophila]|uniref:Transposase n=1 Tax=Parasedimentitalea psychrophila TaxID=2997337 RepID=A0A9Y2P690_9RHOB|nr:transposase [Parasedimentitalea psychrophila]WIY24753.1 transposase [Parasedimentitalea psychrophila]